MFDSKLIIGIAIGFLACHFLYKKKYQIKDNSIDKKLKQAEENLREFLQLEKGDNSNYDVEKVAKEVFSSKPTKISNFIGTAKDIL